MKKFFVTMFLCTVLGTSLLAEIKPYIGLGVNSFSINSSAVYIMNDDGNIGVLNVEPQGVKTLGLNGGVILSDNSKVNIFYFSGTESEVPSSLLLQRTVTVAGATYDYSFNNQGIHKGFYLGAGVSNIKIDYNFNFDNGVFDASVIDGSAGSIGVLAKGGYEYVVNKNILLNVGYSFHIASQEYKNKPYGYNGFNMTTDINNLNFSVNYIF